MFPVTDSNSEPTDPAFDAGENYLCVLLANGTGLSEHNFSQASAEARPRAPGGKKKVNAVADTADPASIAICSAPESPPASATAAIYFAPGTPLPLREHCTWQRKRSCPLRSRGFAGRVGVA